MSAKKSKQPNYFPVVPYNSKIKFKQPRCFPVKWIDDHKLRKAVLEVAFFLRTIVDEFNRHVEVQMAFNPKGDPLVTIHLLDHKPDSEDKEYLQMAAKEQRDKDQLE